MPKRKIVISEHDNIATIFEDDRAVEFLIHRGDILLGDIFLAQVENILPSIDAAFVNVGGDKMGFLHSSDVPGRGDLKNRLQPKQTLLVQVMKEPTGHKGPRVTTNISLPGRFLVMMPESKGISISRKIVEQKERSRLKSAVSLIKPPGVGVIIRTEALEQKDADIQEDFETLLERWQTIVSMADTATPPTLLYRDQDLLYRVIREAVNEDVNEIVVDSNFGLQRAQQLLQNWNLDKTIKASQYTGSQPIMIGLGVDREIKMALQTKVPLPSGGYLYIQPTEALTVVDVNSGKFTSLDSQAETIKLTNLEACKEIARQLRLRNIGGMIIVDFIDMESRADQLKVMETFENELAPDKAKPQIGQLSDLGLVEMTRHRQGQSLAEIFTRKCSTCHGTGQALEDFNWAPSNQHGDPRLSARTSGRGSQTRHKLPIKQTKPQHQAVPKPAASVHQQNRQPRPSILPLVIEPALKDKEQQNQPGTLFYNRPTDKKQMYARNMIEKSIMDFYKDRMFFEMGLRLANCVKLAMTPVEINSVLSRINPKANDIFSLVYSIEAAPNMPMPHLRRMDEDEEDDSGDEEGESDTEDSESREGLDIRDSHHQNGRMERDDLSDSDSGPEGEATDEELVATAVAIRPSRYEEEDNRPSFDFASEYGLDDAEPIDDGSDETGDEEYEPMDAEDSDTESSATATQDKPKRGRGRPAKRPPKGLPRSGGRGFRKPSSDTPSIE